jgi:hypothetical protein
MSYKFHGMELLVIHSPRNASGGDFSPIAKKASADQELPLQDFLRGFASSAFFAMQ